MTRFVSLRWGQDSVKGGKMDSAAAIALRAACSGIASNRKHTPLPTIRQSQSLAAVAITSDDPGASIRGARRAPRTRDAAFIQQVRMGFFPACLLLLCLRTTPRISIGSPGYLFMVLSHAGTTRRPSPSRSMAVRWPETREGSSGDRDLSNCGRLAGGRPLGILPRATSLDGHTRQSGSGNEQNSWESPQRLALNG